jgi:hypothetical protein
MFCWLSVGLPRVGLAVMALAASVGPAFAGASISGTATNRERMAGMYSYLADAGLFVDCRSGDKLPVAQEGDNAALETAYLKVRPAPGAAVLAVVEGRIETRPPMEGRPRPMLIVDRFIEVATDRNCDSLAGTAASGAPPAR